MTETCPVCTRDVRMPYYRKDARGKVIVGCVDASHGEHLLDSEYRRWWMRKEAKAIRRDLKKMRCK